MSQLRYNVINGHMSDCIYNFESRDQIEKRTCSEKTIEGEKCKKSVVVRSCNKQLCSIHYSNFCENEGDMLANCSYCCNNKCRSEGISPREMCSINKHTFTKITGLPNKYDHYNEKCCKKAVNNFIKKHQETKIKRKHSDKKVIDEDENDTDEEPSNIKEAQILVPINNDINEVKELNKKQKIIYNYCTNCGIKIQQTWNFCGNCGYKII